MTLRRDNKTGIPGLPYDERRGKWNVRVGSKSYGYYEDKDLALAVRKLIVGWPTVGLYSYRDLKPITDCLDDWSKP